jgi:hypothetical protein
VRDQLKAAEADGIYLKVSSEKLDDDWLYIEVIPAKPGVRASDHAGLMAQIERNLRADGIDRVLLLPALEELVRAVATCIEYEMAQEKLRGVASADNRVKGGGDVRGQ